MVSTLSTLFAAHANSISFFILIADIVFFIFLYQRWIYKVDKSRVNEFGFSGDMEEEAKKKGAVTANGEAHATEPVAAIEGTPNAQPTPKAKSKKDKKRD